MSGASPDGGSPGQILWKTFPGNNNLVLEPLLAGPPGQSLWKAFPGNNDLVLEPLLGGLLGQSFWKAFPGNNNLVLEPLLAGPSGQRYWEAFPGDNNVVLELLLGGSSGQSFWALTGQLQNSLFSNKTLIKKSRNRNALALASARGGTRQFYFRWSYQTAAMFCPGWAIKEKQTVHMYFLGKSLKK